MPPAYTWMLTDDAMLDWQEEGISDDFQHDRQQATAEW